MIDVNHEKWTERDDLRAEWEVFSKTEAFQAGIEALESHATIVPPAPQGFDPGTYAAQAAFRAGFANAVAMVRNLHKSVERPIEPEPEPWAHLLPPQYLTQKPDA